MKKILNKWNFGSFCLIQDDHISYYTFFTIILAECSYLWVFHKPEIAIPLTLIMLGYIANVIVTAWIKGIVEGSVFDTIMSAFYVFVFLFLLVLSFKYNIALSIIFNVILFAGTAIAKLIRGFQDSVHLTDNKFILFIDKLFANKTFWLISQIILIGIPFVTFTLLFVQITYIPVILKIIVPFLYALILPFIAALEDDLCARDIFELIYEF